MVSFRAPISVTIERQLGRASDRVSQSFTRLSSGMRINRASDDAAGLAIADNLRNDARLSGAAIRNINDGLSALNIATSALQSQNEIITRLQELAEQNANGTYTNTQRENANREYQALLREFARIGDTTKFNGVNLMQGGRLGASPDILLQAGISGSSSSIIAATMPNSGTLSGTINEFTSPIPEIAVGETSTFDAIDSGNGSSYRATIIDSLGQSRDVLISIGAFSDSGSGAISIITYIRGDQSNGTYTSSHDLWVGIGSTSISYDLAKGQITSNSAQTLSFSQFTNNATGQLRLDFSGLRMKAASSIGNVSAIELSGIETASQSRSAMNILATRQSELSQQLGKLGAVQSRLGTAVNVLGTQRENTTAAESRIRDIDVAAEAAALTASQIAQQVSASVLSQANQAPRLALDLLR